MSADHPQFTAEQLRDVERILNHGGSSTSARTVTAFETKVEPPITSPPKWPSAEDYRGAIGAIANLIGGENSRPRAIQLIRAVKDKHPAVAHLFHTDLGVRLQRRDADMAGFLFWLGQVSSAPLRDVPKQHAMVCSFITSAEYQLRFSSIVTHSNAECPR